MRPIKDGDTAGDQQDFMFVSGQRIEIFLIKKKFISCEIKILSSFPDSPVVKTLCYRCRMCNGLIYNWRTKILQVVGHGKKKFFLKSLHRPSIFRRVF